VTRRSRFTVDASGQLVDREGHVLGRLVSLTLETPEAAGTIGVAVPSGEQQELEDVEPPTPSAPNTARAQAEMIERVWAHYVEVMKPRNRELDPQARGVIRDALKVATEVECKDAITGCAKSTFHMGQNDRRKRYNALSQILKGKRGGRTTREQIDFFLDVAEKAGARSGVQSGVTSASSGKISQARRAVLDAWEFPGDGLVVSRGEEAARWLRAQGWRVVLGDGERPRFIAPGSEE
jgi:hypothetical protein